MNTDESIEFLLRTANHLQAIGESDSIVDGLKEVASHLQELDEYLNEISYRDSMEDRPQ